MCVVILIMASIGYMSIFYQHYYEKNQVSVEDNHILEKTLLIQEYQTIINKDYIYSKYEPDVGTYLGSYNLSNRFINHSTEKMDELMKKKHLLNLYYVKIGEKVPDAWLVECIALEKVPYIIMIYGGHKLSTEYERHLSTTLESLKNYAIPMFIDFSSNSFEKDLILDGRLTQVLKGLKKEMEEAAIVYSVHLSSWSDEKATISLAMPFIDWLGLKIHVDTTTDDAITVADIEAFYKEYEREKPLIMSELGVLNYTNKNHRYVIEDAGKKIMNLYKVVERLPRIKGINYLNVNITDPDLAKGVYAVSEDISLRNIYSRAIQAPVFTNKLNKARKGFTKGQIEHIIDVKVLAYNGQSHIKKGIFTDYNVKDTTQLSQVLFNDEIYYSLDEIAAMMGLDVMIDHQFKLVKFE